MFVNQIDALFKQWLLKNPGGTMEQFTAARNKVMSKAMGTPPNVGFLPDGSLISTVGISPVELGTMAREHVQSSRTNQ